jgi:hypothetical protein
VVVRTGIAKPWPWIALLVASLLALAPWQPAGAQDAGRVYVGRLAGADSANTLVGVVVAADGTAVGYVCSDTEAWNRQNSKWFEGQLAGNELTLRARDGTELKAQLQGSRLAGTLGSLSWSADQVTGGTAGLYRGRAGDEVHAVIEDQYGLRVGGVWVVGSGNWAWTWHFPTATVERTTGGLRAERPATADQQFVTVDLSVCLSPINCG